MTSWAERFSKFKSTVEKEKDTKKETVENAQGTCVHGDTNCVRCVTEIFDTQEDDKVWDSLDTNDIKRIVYSLPENVTTCLRRYAGKSVLAGGYIRAAIANEAIHDIDIFVPTKRDAEIFVSQGFSDVKAEDKHYQATASGIELQVIWRYPYTQAYEILEQFDYTVAKAAIWFDEGYSKGRKKIEPDFKSICHERFYKDIARKLLVYDCDREVERIESIPRLLKYVGYGYSIEPDSLAEVVIKTCLSMDLSAGFDGMKKHLSTCYKPTGKDKDWKKMIEVYVPPPAPKRSHDYGYGS